MNIHALHLHGITAATFMMLCSLTSRASAAEDTKPQPAELPGIHNAFRVTARILSGSQPEGDDAFAALAKAGVKTIISVDGAKPDIATAKKFGLRYVHLPIGYDGIPAQRVAELAKAAAPGAGEIFIHCHHGKHRGPAAAALICEATEHWTPAQAEAWMKQAGTAPDYAGLYRSARDFRVPDAAQLAAIGELPETAKTPALVDAMVAVDDLFDRLKQPQSAGWRIAVKNPGRDPAHTATLLHEQLRELARTDAVLTQGDDFRRLLTESEKAAASLRETLRTSPNEKTPLDASLKRVSESCTACHKTYRNEKKKMSP